MPTPDGEHHVSRHHHVSSPSAQAPAAISAGTPTLPLFRQSDFGPKAEILTLSKSWGESGENGQPRRKGLHKLHLHSVHSRLGEGHLSTVNHKKQFLLSGLGKHLDGRWEGATRRGLGKHGWCRQGAFLGRGMPAPLIGFKTELTEPLAPGHPQTAAPTGSSLFPKAHSSSTQLPHIFPRTLNPLYMVNARETIVTLYFSGNEVKKAKRTSSARTQHFSLSSPSL